MNISQRDVMLLLTMSLAVVSISFVFPALGLGGESVQENELPQFDIETDRFDVAGDFPASPGTPSSGTLIYDSEESVNQNQVWLTGGTDGGGYELVLLPNGTEADIRINEWNGSAFEGYNQTIVGPNDSTGTVERDAWGITVETTERFDGDEDTSAGYYEVEYEIIDEPGDGGSLGERIPIVGSIISGTNALAGMVGWIGSIIYWAVQVFFEGILNITGIGYDISSYFIGLFSWLSSTYFGIVSSAGASWVSVFVALPGILLSVMLGKFAIIGVRLIPGI